jgi:Tetraspanin family
MGAILVVLNTCFVLAGLCIAAGGIYLSVRLWDWSLVVIPLCVFVLGLLVVVVSLLGCMGALRKSRCLLCTYFVLIALLLVGQGFALAGIFVVRSDAEKVLGNAWTNHLSCDDKNVRLCTSFPTLSLSLLLGSHELVKPF